MRERLSGAVYVFLHVLFAGYESFNEGGGGKGCFKYLLTFKVEERGSRKRKFNLGDEDVHLLPCEINNP